MIKKINDTGFRIHLGMLGSLLVLAGCAETLVEPPGEPETRTSAVYHTPTPARHAAVKVPPRPVRVSEGEVLADYYERLGTGHLGFREARYFASTFDHALTIRGLNHLAGSALAGLHGNHRPAAEKLRRQIYTRYNRYAPGVRPTYTIGFEGSGECDVDFDDSGILDMFIDDVQATYSTPPHWEQPCGSGEVQVHPTVSSHYHLNYEDPTVNCIDLDNGLFGRMVDGECVALDDHTVEPRYLGSHEGNEIIRIRLRAGGSNQPFTMHSFANVGDRAVQFRYRTSGGTWYEWSSLAGNTIWDVSAYVVDVKMIHITAPGSTVDCGPDWEAGLPGGCPVDDAPFFLDDLSISP